MPGLISPFKFIFLLRVYETTSKWHSPKMELYCMMRNLILALWFLNFKVRHRMPLCKCISCDLLEEYDTPECKDTYNGLVNASVAKDMKGGSKCATPIQSM